VKIRFQADADLNEDIGAGILRREPRVDFQTAGQAGLRGLDDVEALAIAARDGRVLVSHDRKTMPAHFAEFLRSSGSPGLFIVSQKTDLLSAIEALLFVWAASEAEEWVNTICAIPL
jgi:predicted nuclease of predicted toxin-antitoxin system